MYPTPFYSAAILHGLNFPCHKRNEPKASRTATLMDAAMDKVISEELVVTRDLGGKASTKEMGDAVSTAIREVL